MLPTFGLTGMDANTETALKSAFAEASMRLGGRWPLVSEQDATHVVVDMDSMYGPMSWLRLHGAGKVVIGLTSAPRSQTDFRGPQIRFVLHALQLQPIQVDLRNRASLKSVPVYA